MLLKKTYLDHILVDLTVCISSAFSIFFRAIFKVYSVSVTLADFKYGVNTDVNIGVSVTRGGNTLFEVMGIC